MNNINLNEIRDFFDQKIRTYGTTPKGVDWGTEQAQSIRFKQVLRVLDYAPPGVILADIGCGYGQLLEYLPPELEIKYRGYDLSPTMVEQARLQHNHRSHCEFRQNISYDDVESCDYLVASGIFNMKLDADPFDWMKYITNSLDHFHRLARRGFAFNMLTAYSDPEHMRSDLFYADPCKLFDHCKKSYSKNVALLHDYGIYDFTIVVRKDL
jgi:SAM-dependent methyltransferase